MSTSAERGKFSKRNSTAEISSKDSPTCKILGTILKIDKRGTQIKGQKERKLMIMYKALNPRDDINSMC